MRTRNQIVFLVEYNAIRAFSLAQLICENTDGMEEVQTDVFQHKYVSMSLCTNRTFNVSSFQRSQGSLQQLPTFPY